MDVVVPLASILALVTTIFLLVFGLFTAPWQLLFLLLVSGLLGIRWLMEQNHLTRSAQQLTGLGIDVQDLNHAGSLDPSSVKKPLTYRGACYTPQSLKTAIAQATSVEVSGKYRGGLWKKPTNTPPVPPDMPANPKPEITGKYRGCTWKS